MKKRNKILIRLLTAILCVSFLPITVMADNDSTNLENHFAVWTVNEENEESEYATFWVEANSTKELSVSVSADDNSGISYQWSYYDGNPIDGYTEVNIEGATGASYVAGPMNRSTQYMCNVTDSISATTKLVTFYVNVINVCSVNFVGYDDPYIEVTVPKGETKTFTVNVDANETDGLIYRWYWNSELIEGETTDTYTTPAINGSNILACIVYDKYGNYTSTTASLYYDNQLTAWRANSEDYDADSNSYIVAPNAKKTLTVTASAIEDSGIRYQWYKWALCEEGYSVRDELTGETSPSCLTDEIKYGDAYSCLVEDQLSGQYVYVDFYFTIQNHFSVSLKDSEAMEDGSYAFTVTPGESRTLEVVAVADEVDGITYAWYWYDGSEDSSILVEDAITGTFTTPEIRSWSYAECYVKDKYGNSRCITVFFDVDNEFDAWKTTGDDDIIVSLGDDAELGVAVSALDESLISYQWFRDLNDGTSYEDHPIEGATGATYTVESVSASSTYVCEVTDKAGSSTYVLFFEVKITNQFGARDKEINSHYIYKRVPVGKTKTLSVEVFGDDLDGVTYEWYLDGELTAETSDTFVSPAIGDTEEICVVCVASDKYGNTDQVEYTLFGTNDFESWATTTSQARYKPYGKGMGVQPGSFVTLSVSSEWESDLTYEWTINDGYYRTPSDDGYENTSVISEATGDTIVVGPINTFTMVSCKMTNEFGNSTTIEFYIWVSNPEFELSMLPDKLMSYTEMYPELGDYADIYAFGLGNDGDFQRVWYKNTEVISGAADGRYRIENIQTSDTYYCFAHDRYNNYSHVTYEVIVNQSFQAWATESGIYERKEWAYFIQEGQDPVLSVSTNAADGSPVSYQWFYMDEDDEEKTLCPDTVNASAYTIKISEGATAHDYYLCKVTDQYNNTRWVLFTHQDKAYAWMLFEQNSQADICEVYFDRGQTMVLEVVTTSVDDSKFSFQWYMGDVSEETKIEGATSSVYSIPSYSGSHIYFCVVKYDGVELRTLEFDVTDRGAWITGTDYETSDFVDVKRGESATLSVSVIDAIESPRYQWYLFDCDDEGYGEYVPIQGANSATYETEPVVKDFDLRCEVIDDNGSTYELFFWIGVDNSEVEPAKLLASNLTLDGYLKVNFKFEFPSELVNDEGSYILINDTKYLVSEADRKGGEYYYFTYSVVSSEVQKAIVLQAFSSNGEVFPLATNAGIDYSDGYTYSITQYLETVKAMPDEQLSAYTNKPDQLRQLVTRLGEFGTLSQAYFKDNRSSGYISDAEMARIDNIHARNLAGYQATVTKSANNKIKYTANLSLETATHLNHYFTLEDGRSIDEYKIYVNNNLITTESTGKITLTLVGNNKYCLKIDDIAAPDLDVGYNISVVEKQSGETLISVEGFSALSYIYLYLNLYENDASKADIVRVLKSLYRYNTAANGYFE